MERSKPKSGARRSRSATASYLIYADGKKWTVTRRMWSRSGEKLLADQSAHGNGLESLRDFLNTWFPMCFDTLELPTCFELESRYGKPQTPSA